MILPIWIVPGKAQSIRGFSGQLRHSDVAKQSQLLGQKLHLSDFKGNTRYETAIRSDATFVFERVIPGTYVAYVKDGHEAVAVSEEFAIRPDKLPREIIVNDPLQVDFNEQKVVLGEAVTLKWNSPFADHVDIDPLQRNQKRNGEITFFPLKSNLELTVRVFGPYGDVARTVTTGVVSIPHQPGVDTAVKTRYALASWLSPPNENLVKSNIFLLAPPNLDQNAQLWLNFRVLDLGQEFENSTQNVPSQMPGYEKTVNIVAVFAQQEKDSIKVRYWSRDVLQKDAAKTIKLAEAQSNQWMYFVIEPRYPGPIDIFTAIQSPADLNEIIPGHLRLFSDAVSQHAAKSREESAVLHLLTCMSPVTTEAFGNSIYVEAPLRVIVGTRPDLNCGVPSRTPDVMTHYDRRVFLRWLCTECEPTSGETYVDISRQTAFGEVSLNVRVSERSRRPNVRFFLADTNRSYLGQAHAFDLPTVTSRQPNSFVNFLQTLLSLGNRQPGPITTLFFQGQPVDTISFDRRSPVKQVEVPRGSLDDFRYSSGSPPTDVTITVFPVNKDQPFRLDWKTTHETDNLNPRTATLHGVTPFELAKVLNALRTKLASLSEKSEFYKWQVPSFEQHRKLLYEYAQLGNILWDDTFGKGKPEQVRDMLAEMKRAEEAGDKDRPLFVAVIGRLEKIDQSYEFILPFQLLYDDKKFLRDHPKVETIHEEDWQQFLRGFWGYKYAIVYPLEPKPQSVSLRNIKVQTALDAHDTDLGNCVRSQKLEFEDFEHSHGSVFVLDTQPLADENSLRRLLLEDTNSPDFLYYYGHSYADPQGNDHLSGLRFAGGAGITISELAGNSDIERFTDGNPILFLNSCSGAQLAALAQEFMFDNLVDTKFFDYLSRRGFMGFLAPELNVESQFAARFASEFLQRWLHSGRSIDEVLFSLRRQALEDPRGNPSSLLYSYFGNGDVRFDQLLSDTAKQAPHWHHMVIGDCLENLGQKPKQ